MFFHNCFNFRSEFSSFKQLLFNVNLHLFLIENFPSAGFGFLPDSWKSELLEIHLTVTLQLTIQVTKGVERIPDWSGNYNLQYIYIYNLYITDGLKGEKKVCQQFLDQKSNGIIIILGF